MYDLIIVGSGPAGLSAAIYAKRAGLSLLVLEKNPMSGGQVLNTYEVDNYLGMPGINGFDMGVQFRAHADKLEIPFETASVTGITDKGAVKVVHTEDGDREARAVIWSAGAEHAHLGIEGEERLSGMGVSYCATCDGAFFRGKRVAVIGGGNVALEDAVYLSRFCEKVYIIHRRDEFRGEKILQDELLSKPNVEPLYSHGGREILGDEMVEGLKVANLKTGEEYTLDVSGVFIAVGIKPITEQVGALLERDETGYVLAGEDCVTSVEGIFVAGDSRHKPLRQIATAVADGANAAASVSAYISRLSREYRL